MVRTRSHVANLPMDRPIIKSQSSPPKPAMLVKIVGTGRHLPERIETSEEVALQLGVTAEWIVSHMGVLRRHLSDEPMALMAARAAKQALGEGPPPDLIINASAVPHQLVPDSSVFIQDALGFSGIPSFTVNATCLSFPVAIYNASSLIVAGAYSRVLIVSSDLGSRGRNLKEVESAALFGDGAGAAVLQATPQGESSAVLGFQMGTWPKAAKLTEVRGGGTRQHPQDPSTRPEDNLFHMDGPRVYKFALPRVAPTFKALFDRCGVSAKDIAAVVMHQASGPAVEFVSRFFRAGAVVNRVAEEGNCVAASIPMTLAYAHQQGLVRRGDLVVICGTGAGLSVMAMLLRW